jgi:hypothetical protein
MKNSEYWNSPYPCGRRRSSSLLASPELSLELLDRRKSHRLLLLFLVGPYWLLVLLNPELRVIYD